MVYTCFLCKWRSDKHPQRSYHKFPSNNELKKKWLDILGKSNVSVGARTTLCCVHFEEDCFRYGLVYGRKVLKDGSLPTLYLTKDTKRQTINPIDRILPIFPTDARLQTQHLTTNVQMKEQASELNIEDSKNHVSSSEIKIQNNLTPVPIKIWLPGRSSRLSGSLDIQPANDEIKRLKKKVLMLQRYVKRLRSSNSQMKTLLSQLKKKVIKYKAENKSKVHLDSVSPKGLNGFSRYKLENIRPSDVMVTIKKEPDINEGFVTDDMVPLGEMQGNSADFKIEIKEELPNTEKKVSEYFMTLEPTNYK